MPLFLLSGKCTIKCLNGGECELTDDGGKCVCPEGYKGDYCEQGNRFKLLYSDSHLFNAFQQLNTSEYYNLR